MASRLACGIRFLVMDGLSEALKALRNCELNGTCVGIFREKDPELSDSPEGVLYVKKKRLKVPFSRPFPPK